VTPISFSVSCVRLARTVSSISVLAKCRLVLFEAEATEPFAEVYEATLAGRSR
jgi:hypothetical protein